MPRSRSEEPAAPPRARPQITGAYMYVSWICPFKWYQVLMKPGFPSKANMLGVLVMVLLMLVLKRLMSRTMLGVEVLVPSFVRFVQLAVELAVLPFRHRILVPRLMCLTKGLVLITMFGIEVSVLATMFGVQVLMLSP